MTIFDLSTKSIFLLLFGIMSHILFAIPCHIHFHLDSPLSLSLLSSTLEKTIVGFALRRNHIWFKDQETYLILHLNTSTTT
jgi:hypothetical protein